MNRIQKTIIISVFISFAGTLKFEVLTEGFIVAFSVVLLGVFIYSYEELSPLYIAVLAGVFSPLTRMLLLFMHGETIRNIAMFGMPDMAFFFTYGIVFVLIYKLPGVMKKSLGNFPFVILFSEFTANLVEISVRSLLAKEILFSFYIIGMLFLLAVGRALIVLMIIVAMESYGSLMVRKEHEEEYKKLLSLASFLESELYFMNKSTGDIEDIMKKAYSLHRQMEKLDLPKELTNTSLSISKDAHEIKGDYLRTMGALKRQFIDKYERNEFSIGDLIQILKTDIFETGEDASQQVKFLTTIKADFTTKHHFELMAILRNLTLNSIEAIGRSKGHIHIKVSKEDRYIVQVVDSGKGMRESVLKDIFTHGFSTKFDEATGNVQRGVGLVIVKDYVENLFHGTIVMESVQGEGTVCTMEFPLDSFGEVR